MIVITHLDLLFVINLKSWQVTVRMNKLKKKHISIGGALSVMI